MRSVHPEVPSTAPLELRGHKWHHSSCVVLLRGAAPAVEGHYFSVENDRDASGAALGRLGGLSVQELRDLFPEATQILQGSKRTHFAIKEGLLLSKLLFESHLAAILYGRLKQLHSFLTLQ